MKRSIFLLLVLLSVQCFALQVIYTKHIIAKGETLYSLAKQYEVSVDEIKNTNVGMDFSALKIGQTINIPLPVKGAKQQVSTTTKSNGTGAAPSSTAKYHTVKAGESMYQLCKLYGISIDNLNKWNTISNNSIKIGQVLRVSEQKTSSTAIKTNKENMDEDVTDPTTRNTSTNTTTTPVKTTTISTPTPVNTISEKSSTISSDYNTNKTSATGKKEKGIGMSMIDAGDNPNYIAIYSGASIGSMITVRNLMNGKSIQAKVVGKIPNLDRNKDVLVKISSNAYSQLGALDEKFLVEVIY